MAVLITGLGYIGAALAERLLGDGEQVVAIENFFSTPREVVSQLSRAERVQLIEGSVADPEVIERAFAVGEVHTVFHLAAQASADPAAASPEYTERTNYTGARLVLEACAAHQVQRVVVASSTRLYAPPLPEVITEASPLAPADLVHLSHLYAEVLLRDVGRRHPLATLTAARLGAVHGVGPVLKTDPRFLAAPQRFCLQAAEGNPLRVDGGPSAVLALIQLQDAVEGLIRCAQLPPGFNVANLAAEVRGVGEIARVVQEAARARGLEVTLAGEAPPPEPPRRVESVLQRLGFSPTKRIEDSLPAVLGRYLALRQIQRAAPGPTESGRERR